MKILRIEEFKINKKQHSEISELLKLCFSSYPSNRSFYKQFPSFRYLVFKENELIAHLAIIHRMIKVGEENFVIFGVSDLCVHPEFQQKKNCKCVVRRIRKLRKKTQN